MRLEWTEDEDQPNIHFITHTIFYAYLLSECKKLFMASSVCCSRSLSENKSVRKILLYRVLLLMAPAIDDSNGLWGDLIKTAKRWLKWIRKYKYSTYSAWCKKAFGPKEVGTGKVTDKTFEWYRNKQPEITVHAQYFALFVYFFSQRIQRKENL